MDVLDTKKGFSVEVLEAYAHSIECGGSDYLLADMAKELLMYKFGIGKEKTNVRSDN